MIRSTVSTIRYSRTMWTRLIAWHVDCVQEWSGTTNSVPISALRSADLSNQAWGEKAALKACCPIWNPRPSYSRQYRRIFRLEQRQGRNDVCDRDQR